MSELLDFITANLSHFPDTELAILAYLMRLRVAPTPDYRTQTTHEITVGTGEPHRAVNSAVWRLKVRYNLLVNHAPRGHIESWGINDLPYQVVLIPEARNLNNAERAAICTALAEQHGWVCHYCGNEVVNSFRPGYEQARRPGKTGGTPPGRYAVIDHIVARSNGGTNDLSNLALACVSCNTRKNDKSYAWAIANLRPA